MSVPVGITVPKMLPITGTWLVPFTAYLFLLSGRVAKMRVDNNKLIGERLSQSSASDSDKKVDPLQVATRSHQNYLENMPYALLTAAIVELNGGDRKALTGGLAALLLFRILHVEFGMRAEDTIGLGRPIGYLGTGAFLGSMSAYAVYLVKGYWGF